MDSEEIYERLVSRLCKLQRELTELPLLADSSSSQQHQPLMSLLSHTHFINYGGGYY